MTDWQRYEAVATEILNALAEEFQLQRVEPKQLVSGKRSGRMWEIDAEGISLHDGGIVLVEVRSSRKGRVKAEQIGGLAYRIFDTGAASGIVVSPLPLQKGAKQLARAEGILAVRLRVPCTPEVFVLQFLNRILMRLPSDAFSSSATIVGGSLESVEPK